MININRLDSRRADFADRLQTLLQPPDDDSAVRDAVAEMYAQIERDGDSALLDITQRFDCHRPAKAAGFEVSREALRQAEESLPAQLKADLHTAAERLRDYHRRQLPGGWRYTDSLGNTLGEIINPVERAVVYAPGGAAAYPSSVLMGVIPAAIAGVEEIILTTPAPYGQIPEVTLAAAAIAGCGRVFMLGGAQAIIGFALGTETLPAADVIVGPGNAYVTEAKRQAAGMVGIDSLAGPSEVLIISDGSAPAAWVAADLAAQAEHDAQAQCILISDSIDHIGDVIDALGALLPGLERAETVRASLDARGACIVAGSLEECCDIANDIAPEHLQIMTENAEALAERITDAGCLFIGRCSCVPFGDYIAGTNHVLPTAGTARFSSPLGVTHFIKRSGLFCASAAGAAALAPAAARLAEAEGLGAHAHAARLREEKD